jgi:hypothetical protein
MYDSTMIRHLIAEAAEIERRLARVGPSAGRVRWDIQHDHADRADWNVADEKVRAMRRRTVTRDELDIRDQVERWIMSTKDPRYPQNYELLREWFVCQARGRSFSQWLRSSKWTRPTAYRRLDQMFQRIAAKANEELLSAAA